jgi:glyoxylase-like metal-dependent hydrolase (beta-lactamase superfamily II)
MSPLKIVRLIKPEIIERSVLNLIYKRVISKFEPLSPSRETAIPFENRQRQTLTLGTVTLTGWNFDNDIFVVESRGHTTDSVSFYLPKDKVLFLSDETIIFFNIWSDSNSENIVNILRKSVRLYEQGFVDVLVGGHEQKPLRGREIVEFLETRLEDHEVFNNELDAALKGCTRGATVKKLYQKLKRRKHLPAIKKHFDFEFPKMPPMLKSNITNALLEKGLVAEGEKGKKVFKYPL